MTSIKEKPRYLSRQKIHEILTNQVQTLPIQHCRQNSDNIKLLKITEQDQRTPLMSTRKTIDQNVTSKNLTKLKLCHHKQGSLDFEPFQLNNGTKFGKFTQIKSARSKKINHFDLSKQINNINNCQLENKNQNIKTQSQFKNEQIYDENILDLLLLNTMELKEMLSVNNEPAKKTQRIKPKITFITNTKGLPHDFFFQQ
ncbi:unnamed protein product (macronuclear) [Paramecium tetraurelia]|uniref:Uncharacterized protein n=1 Tax=Paramecium tetraurelia TaxID=5888 RepID=A0CGK6_PARTE|nr:uncharacterized protein GSPATT00007363001 [Paramecium tetraurelia]CAK69923.1 unnamed protein product [Paramecium tetraurelia]|eukprot:XP_001437320.1 hypothetical protein (macronuclear) [Paramecium tetraurelia strain d4-2]